MGLVVTRRIKQGMRVSTPDGSILVSVSQIRGKQVRIGIDCKREFKIERVDSIDLSDINSTPRSENKEVIKTFKPEDLNGKKLDMIFSKDDSSDCSYLFGLERHTGKLYVIQEFKNG